jgi:hypothetical protein
MLHKLTAALLAFVAALDLAVGVVGLATGHTFSAAADVAAGLVFAMLAGLFYKKGLQ